jgi:hypothetical protein
VIYPNLRHAPEFDGWIAKLIEWDSAAMRRRQSYSTVIIAEPR